MASKPTYLQGRGRGRGNAGNGRGSPQSSVSNAGRPGKMKSADSGLGGNSTSPKVSYSKVTGMQHVTARVMQPDNGDRLDVNNGNYLLFNNIIFPKILYI